jgi:hypothetical protein
MAINNIYAVGRKLGLEKNQIDIVINTPCKKTNIEPCSSIYKVGALYATISPNNY